MKTHSADEANELFVLWNRCAGPWTVAGTAWNPVYKRAITSMLNCIFHHICRWRANVLHWRWWLRLVPTWVSQRLATNINQLWGLGRSMVSPVDRQNQAVGINNILYYQCTESAQLCVCHINRTQTDMLSRYLGSGFKHFLMFNPYFGEKNLSNLTIIFFQWVGEKTTN